MPEPNMYAYYVPNVMSDTIWDINGNPQYRGVIVNNLPVQDNNYSIQLDPDNIPDLCRSLTSQQFPNFIITINSGGQLIQLSPQPFVGGRPDRR